MENSLIILQKLVVLFCFIFVGFYAFKRKWITKDGSAQISKLVVNIFNPALVIATAVCNTKRPSASLVLTDALMVCVFFFSLILVSPLVARILRISKQNQGIFRIMMAFANTGFMGIPLVAAIYGQNATIYVSMYILGFNFMFYTYAFNIYRKASGDSSRFSFKDLFNMGTITGVIAILAFIFPLNYPAFVIDIMSSASDLCIMLAMIITGFSLAQVEFKRIFTDVKIYAFTLIRMIIIPLLMMCIFKYVVGDLINPTIAGIAIIMFTMPNGSMPLIACEDFGIDSDFPSRTYAFTTLVSIITIPIVISMI